MLNYQRVNLYNRGLNPAMVLFCSTVHVQRSLDHGQCAPAIAQGPQGSVTARDSGNLIMEHTGTISPPKVSVELTTFLPPLQVKILPRWPGGVVFGRSKNCCWCRFVVVSSHPVARTCQNHVHIFCRDQVQEKLIRHHCNAFTWLGNLYGFLSFLSGWSFGT